MSLNAALLAVAGSAVYGLLLYRASKLPEKEQRILTTEVFVARGSLKEKPFDFKAEVAELLAARLKDANTNGMDFGYVQTMAEQEYRAQREVVPPNNIRSWRLPVGLTDRALGQDLFHLRFRFYGADTNSLKEHTGEWRVGSGEHVIRSSQLPLAANTLHEVPVSLSYL
jgi:hypothetical protein